MIIYICKIKIAAPGMVEDNRGKFQIDDSEITTRASPKCSTNRGQSTMLRRSEVVSKEGGDRVS